MSNKLLPPVGTTRGEWELVFTEDAFLVIAHWEGRAVTVFPGSRDVHAYDADDFKLALPAAPKEEGHE